MPVTYPLIPKEAFLLFPQGKDISYEQKGTTKRLIFGNGTYPQYHQGEKKKIQEFIQYARKDQKGKEVLNQTQNMLLLKMLYAQKYNLQNALSNLNDYKKWERQFVPVQSITPEYRQQMDTLLKTGVFYVPPSRDQYFKPIIIVHVGRLLTIKPQKKLFLDSFGYFLQTIIDTMMISGQLQTWNVIVDVDQTSVFSFGGVLFDLIKFLSRIFIGRMYRCYVVDYPFLISFMWGTVSVMMDEEQNEKCRLLEKEDMVKWMPKEALERKYGGDLAMVECFWPLDAPQRLKIQLSTEQKMRKHWVSQNNLITERQYYQNQKKGKIGNKISKSIIDKFQKQEQIQLLTSQGALSYKLSISEIKQLNARINVERKPCCLKIGRQMNVNRQVENCSSVNLTQIGEFSVGGISKSQKRIDFHYVVVGKQVFSQRSFSSHSTSQR